MQRTLLVTLVLALGVHGSAQAIQLPVAKKMSVRSAQEFWATDEPDALLPWLRYELLSRPHVQRCRRLSPHKVHCVVLNVMRDNYGCGYGAARVSVSRRVRVTHAVWRPFYDEATTEYDPTSCTKHGYQAWRGTLIQRGR